ncbi:TOX high mobility group box family member 4b isoform X2 [Periophthalmus magnuspinnatus]|uniref:TOX high mobility group box family member 4b isoform X2 n=1 Tax=Periophthalmus magnuspinnatus TaxID=409849 RepID=UPI00145BFA8D|nr:TOX high mobility group box family member 4b isoform X2 [Periophthalmus magnuspinnatus]
MDLNFYSDLTDGTVQNDAEFLDPHSFNGFDTDNKFPGGSDNYLTISGSGHPFLSTSETFHTPSLGDEEFEIPPISLDPDSALSMSDVVSHFGGLSDPGAPDSVVVPENAVVEGEDPSFASTYGSSQGLEHLNLAVMNQAAGSALLGPSLGMDLGHSMASQFDNSSPVTIDVGLLGSSQLTTIDQSELSTHLGLGLGSGPMLPRATEEHPLSATASPTSSLHDDDMDDFRSVLVESPVSLSVSHGVISLDSSLSEAPDSGYTSTVSPAPARKAGGGKKGKGKKKDPNEPQKPVSAYALFFRDTQAAIKGQNPNATFGEVSKIVASMWDSLGEEQKQVYKRKNEIAKKEYLKALAEYRANQLNTTPIEVMDTSPSPPPPVPVAAAPVTTPPVATATRTTRSQHYNPEENTITNICTSNIIVDLPQVTTRSRTGAIKPTPLPPDSPPSPPPQDTPTVTKIIIKSTPLPSGGVSVTATPAPSTRQPPPLSAPPPPRLQQMVHAQTPPPLQAKPRGAGSTGAAAKAPPPLQIKVVPPQSSGRQDVVAVVKREEPVMLEVGGSTAVVTKTEDGAEAEEGMEVEVNVAPGPTAPPSVSPSICVRAGCTNKAVESKDWDREYCSNECVATHCRDVFMAWCAIRGQNSTTVT